MMADVVMLWGVLYCQWNSVSEHHIFESCILVSVGKRSGISMSGVG